MVLAFALWALGAAQAGWTEHVVVDQSGNLGGPTDVRAVDVDGDGDLDVAVAGWSTIHWYETTDDPTPVRHVIDVQGARRVEPADIDGDGRTDLFACDRWYPNTGSGFDTPVPISGIEDCALVVDVDGDGDLDLVGAALGFAVWHEASGASFGPANVVGPIAHAPLPEWRTGIWGPLLAPADVDGDGDLDLVVPADDALHWYPFDGGSYQAARLIHQDQSPVSKLAVEDFDGDGATEVAVAFDGPPLWFEWDGATLAPVTAPVDEVPTRWGDLEPDGDLDLLFGYDLEDLYWALGNPSGLWTRELVPNMQGLAGFQPTDLADLDEDGDLDILGGYFGVNLAFWSPVFPGTSVGYRQFIGGVEAGDIRNVVSGDVDGDGHTDLLLSLGPDVDDAEGFATENDRLVWYRGEAGHFGHQRVLALGIEVGALALADMDDDGDPDIALVAWPARTDGQTSDLAGPGWIELDAGIPVAHHPVEGASRILDVDGDGYPDWVDGILVRFHRVDRPTQVSGDLPELEAPDTKLLDADGDGDLDLVRCVADVYRWWENADGVFGGVEQAHDADPCGDQLADVDRDGLQDRITSSWADGVFTWSIATGVGPLTFGSETHHELASPYRVYTLRWIDLDVDGRLDPVTERFWVQDRGAGGLKSVPIPPFRSEADVDDDGDPDLVDYRSWQNDLRWYENPRHTSSGSRSPASPDTDEPADPDRNGARDDVTSGCGCQANADATPGWWVLALFALVRRRSTSV